MFESVISRDGGAPWGTTGLTSATWLEVPVRLVLLNSLIATQPGITFEALLRPVGKSYSGDPFAHVVVWQGKNYLEDGHHRAVKAMLRGRVALLARVLEIA